MCDEYKPWLEHSEVLNSAECLYFGDLSGQCQNPGSENNLKPCPTRGRAPWEVAARSRRGEWS